MSQRKKWSKEAMLKAVEAVKNHEMGYLKASKIFNVPRSTLENYVNHPTKTSLDLVSVPLGRKPTLGTDLENELVKYCKEMDRCFYGLRLRDIRVLAYQLAIKNNLNHNFAASKGMAGEKWLKRFFRRNPSLAVRTPRAVSLGRVKTFTHEKVDAFFALLKPELASVNFDPHKIFNVDETGVTIVQGTRSKVISIKGKKEVGKLTSAERGALITVVTCMNAAGVYVPPLIVFPRINMKAELLDGTPPGTIAATHPSGWIQLPIFTDWLHHFIKFVKPTREDPVVLILDGHYSHTRNLSVIDVARENGVKIVSLPPHSTHKLQPLDVAFMAPFKKAYSNEIENWLYAHPFRALTVYQVGTLFGRAFMRSATIETAVNGFKKCGIYPFDPLIFEPSDFIECSSDNQVIATSTSGTSTSHASTSGASTSRDPDVTATSPSPTTPVTSPAGTSSKRVSPFDIRPPPAMPGPSKVGRKGGKAVVVTSSPYKAELTESLEKIAANKRKRSETSKKGADNKPTNGKGRKMQGTGVKAKGKMVKKLFPSIKNQKQACKEQSDSEESDISVKLVSTDDEDSAEECDCIYCGHAYKHDTRGEQWIRCTRCLRWAHELCADSDNWKTYVCDTCKEY